MAVLSGERLEHPDGLLPGARGAALLWQGTALAGGALLGAGLRRLGWRWSSAARRPTAWRRRSAQ